MEVEGIGSIPALGTAELQKLILKQRKSESRKRKGIAFFLVLKPPAELEAELAARPGWNTHLHVTIGFDHADRHGTKKEVNPLLPVDAPREVRLQGLVRQIISRNKRGQMLRSPKGHPLYHYERI